MKRIFFYILVLQSMFVFSQDYKFIAKDLHLMTNQEMMDNQVQITADVPMYDAKGNSIEPSQINDIMSSGIFFPLVYGNQNFIAKAVVFRKATEEEKKEFTAVMGANDPNANFVHGQMATDISAYDITGKMIKLSDYKNKIVVLNFWFTQCKPCVMEISDLNNLVNKYKKDVIFISVTFDKKELIKKFLLNRNFDYTIIAENEGVIVDYNVSAFPTHIIIDKKGEIVFRKIGNFVKEIDEKIGILLDK